MTIIFGGAEIPSNRLLLLNNGVTHISLSYWGLRKRGLPKTKEYLLSEKFPDGVRVYVESGGPQVDAASLGLDDLHEYAADYEHFLTVNEDRISGATEIDAVSLGQRFAAEQRSTFWSDFGEDRFWPIWGHVEGIGRLVSLSQQYPHVAIPGGSVEAETTLSGQTRALRQQYGTEFHALGMAKPDDLRQIPFASVTTLAWLSPMRRGETIVWDGTRLVRYPKKMKDQARKRLGPVCERAGLDHSLVLLDDTTEITRLAVWSYLQLEASMARRDNPFTVVNGGGEGGPASKDHPLVIAPDPFISDNKDVLDDPGSAEGGVSVPDNKATEVVHVHARHPDDMMPLPVFGYRMKTIVDTADDGTEVLRDVPIVESTTATLRQCDTCFVAANCPARKPHSACAFSLPVEVKTRDQLKGLLNTVIEMQGARVAFARFTEELNGGYPDPNVSQEIDRLFKLVKTTKELEESKDFMRLTVERQGSAGVLSAIFGDKVQAMKELPGGGIDAQNTDRLLDGGLNG